MLHRTLHRRILTSAFAAMLLGGHSAYAAQSQTQPAPTTQGQMQALSATITGTQGLVQVRDDGDSPWRTAKVGMVVGEKAEFRTGPKSAVRFEMPGGHVVTIDRLGVAKLMQAVTDNQKTTTKVAMKYGRTSYNIEAAGIENESSIVSPSTTLAIKGTEVVLYDQRPFRPEAVSLTGRAQFQDLKKRVAFGGRNAGRTRVTADQPSAAATALSSASVDPTVRNARTQTEATLVDTLISRGATVAFDRQSDLKVVTGGRPPTDRQLASILPGTLSFVIRWNVNANVDIEVSRSRTDEVLYPATGVNTTASGGRIPFDHRGGPRGGVEIAFWPGTFPIGCYNLSAFVPAGVVDTTAEARLNGKPVPFYDVRNQTVVNRTTVPVFLPNPALDIERTFIGIFGVGVPVETCPGVVPIDLTSSFRSKPQHRSDLQATRTRGVQATKR